jgi:hypothetical protein
MHVSREAERLDVLHAPVDRFTPILSCGGSAAKYGEGSDGEGRRRMTINVQTTLMFANTNPGRTCKAKAKAGQGDSIASG